MSKDVILTGLRSNSSLHLGNYLGAILPIVELQNKHSKDFQINMFIPDLHSFTTPVDHTALYKQSINNLKLFVAAGLDIDDPNTFIYRQSYISAHSELTWILDCFAYVGELSRMTQYKDKQEQNNSIGLLNYPVLMAADILLYDAKWVPLGDDQKQHLELTRDLAIRLNNKFDNELFTIPEEWKKQLEFMSLQQGVRIRSLKNPEKKMSKSIDDPTGTILLSDGPDKAFDKVMSATTDSIGVINFDWEKQPGLANLLQILAIISKKPNEDIINQYKGQTSYAPLKADVGASVRDLFNQLKENYEKVDESKLLQKLESDELKMREIANDKLHAVQKAVGLRP